MRKTVILLQVGDGSKRTLSPPGLSASDAYGYVAEMLAPAWCAIEVPSGTEYIRSSAVVAFEVRSL